MVNDPSNGFVMFSCDENIKFLSSLTTMYVDAAVDVTFGGEIDDGARLVLGE